MADRQNGKIEEGIEEAAVRVGAISAVRELVPLSAQVFALQRALGIGAAKAQTREADRLAKKYGNDHPRVAATRARAEAMAAGAQRLDAGLEGLQNVVETVTTDNLFHGYVVDAQGTPAPKYTVQAAVTGGYAGEKTAKTDKSGYFRIQLGSKRRKSGAAKALRLNTALMQRIDELTANADAATSRKAAAKTASAKTSSTREATAADEGDSKSAEIEELELSVHILDPSGKVVHEDEAPPQMGNGQSAFRYYVLDGSI